jgi:hypothetical protein
MAPKSGVKKTETKKETAAAKAKSKAQAGGKLPTDTLKQMCSKITYDLKSKDPQKVAIAQAAKEKYDSADRDDKKSILDNFRDHPCLKYVSQFTTNKHESDIAESFTVQAWLTKWHTVRLHKYLCFF